MNKPNQSASFAFMFWWIAWLIATVGGPVAVMLLMKRFEDITKWSAGAAILLHLVSSRMLVRLDTTDDRVPGASDKLAAWLLFGGWALMGGVFFFGCLAVVTH